eukprot:TRINITY_DN65025_c0_g1_i1.p1 TRINITY_DN65025_c0_g1~~TRINITY_DN65025_c0_g1_i1.p1  ORF type:complete len:382 (-),score=75.15 TRINITY_DN65025_c0_g1_i1:126-1235(-)
MAAAEPARRAPFAFSRRWSEEEEAEEGEDAVKLSETTTRSSNGPARTILQALQKHGRQPRSQEQCKPRAGGRQDGKLGVLKNHDITQLEPPWEDVTTVIMRNLPNKYTQHMLLKELDSAGFLMQGDFDFLYLPMDHCNCANLGYCFINFPKTSRANDFAAAFVGQRMRCFKSRKTVAVMPASIQGFDANYAHYASSAVARAADPQHRPLFLRSPSSSSPGGGAGGTEWWQKQEAAASNGGMAVGSPVANIQLWEYQVVCSVCGTVCGSEFNFCAYCGTRFAYSPAMHQWSPVAGDCSQQQWLADCSQQDESGYEEALSLQDLSPAALAAATPSESTVSPSRKDKEVEVQHGRALLCAAFRASRLMENEN